MITTKPKYEIGEKVSVGTIMAIFSARYYALMSPGANFECWNKQNKDWFNSFIYTVKLDEPKKSFTFDEFQKANPELDFFVLKEKYEALPLYYYMYIPEFGL